MIASRCKTISAPPWAEQPGNGRKIGGKHDLQTPNPNLPALRRILDPAHSSTPRQVPPLYKPLLGQATEGRGIVSQARPVNIRNLLEECSRLRAINADLLAALEGQQAREQGDPPPWGHNCRWCGDCLLRLIDMRHAAIAKTKGETK